MRFDRRITAVDIHADGMPGRVITGGVPDVPGSTMLEKARYLEAHGDDLRKLKQLTRAIRMGEMEAQGEKLDTVRASMRIEELTDKLEAEQEIHEVTKLRLEDADERASAAELRLETE